MNVFYTDNLKQYIKSGSQAEKCGQSTLHMPLQHLFDELFHTYI